MQKLIAFLQNGNEQEAFEIKYIIYVNIQKMIWFGINLTKYI